MTRSLRVGMPAAVAAGLATLLLTAAAGGAQQRERIRDCGDVSDNLSAITAQGTSCANARRIARAVPQDCEGEQSCRVRSYTCLLGQVGKELTLARCENRSQTRFVRFEFGA